MATIHESESVRIQNKRFQVFLKLQFVTLQSIMQNIKTFGYFCGYNDTNMSCICNADVRLVSIVFMLITRYQVTLELAYHFNPTNALRENGNILRWNQSSKCSLSFVICTTDICGMRVLQGKVTLSDYF